MLDRTAPQSAEPIPPISLNGFTPTSHHQSTAATTLSFAQIERACKRRPHIFIDAYKTVVIGGYPPSLSFLLYLLFHRLQAYSWDGADKTPKFCSTYLWTYIRDILDNIARLFPYQSCRPCGSQGVVTVWVASSNERSICHKLARSLHFPS